MTEFMEVFAVTHMTYVCIFPCFVAFFGLILVAAGEVVSFDAGNLFLYVFVLVFMLLSFGKAFDTMTSAPYFEVRMEQFENDPGTAKLKSLEY
jgi:hypothetical protein